MKNKIVAALLALFLGSLGIHKFYLGQNVAGIIYLLFSWTFIPGIIAFFEFIGLLFMSDDVFNVKYNRFTPSNVYTAIPQESAREKTAILADLKKLYDSGVITAEEYEDKRRKFLDSL